MKSTKKDYMIKAAAIIQTGCGVYHVFQLRFCQDILNFTDGIQLIANILANFVHMIIETTG